MPDNNLLVKIIIPVVVGLLTIGGAIFAMEDRYVSQEEAGQSLQNFNQAVQKDLVHLEVQILSTQKESLTDQYHRLRVEVRQNPSDAFYQQEMDRIGEKLTDIEQKIDRRISVGAGQQ